jgi:hypothetical protein
MQESESIGLAEAKERPVNGRASSWNWHRATRGQRYIVRRKSKKASEMKSGNPEQQNKRNMINMRNMRKKCLESRGWILIENMDAAWKGTYSIRIRPQDKDSELKENNEDREPGGQESVDEE